MWQHQTPEQIVQMKLYISKIICDAVPAAIFYPILLKNVKNPEHGAFYHFY